MVPPDSKGPLQTDPPTAEHRTRVVVVSGMSGAGKTTALKVFEDLGYECIDNVPLVLLRGLFSLSIAGDDGATRPIAIGIDMRTRDFDIPRLLTLIESVQSEHGTLDVSLLFLDSDNEVLAARYTETRRRHPIGGDLPVQDGIVIERRLLRDLREAANVLLDTSRLTVPDFKRIIETHFTTPATQGMTIFAASFGFRNGVPRSADLVFDVRFLRNPHYVPELKPLTGLDEAVGRYVSSDEGYATFFSDLTRLLGNLLPRYEEEGKRYLTIAIGCTGGQHRSVYIAERLSDWIRDGRRRVSTWHRDIGLATQGRLQENTTGGPQ